MFCPKCSPTHSPLPEAMDDTIVVCKEHGSIEGVEAFMMKMKFVESGKNPRDFIHFYLTERLATLIYGGNNLSDLFTSSYADYIETVLNVSLPVIITTNEFGFITDVEPIIHV
jgi:hypothetical protein